MTKKTPSRYFRLQRFLMTYRHIVAACGVILIIFGIVNLISAYVNTYPVVVATRSITAGETLDTSNVHIIKVPTKNLPSSLVTDISSIEGHTACIDIPADAPVITSMARHPVSGPFGTEIVAIPIDPRSVDVMQSGVDLQLYGYEADCHDDCTMKALDFSAQLVNFQRSTSSSNDIFSDDTVQLIEVAVPRASVDSLINSALKAPLYASVKAEKER